MGQALDFTAWCLGFDETYNATAEAFKCENLASCKVLDCGATDTVGSVESIVAVMENDQEAFGTDVDGVSVDTSDRPVYKYGDFKRKQGTAWSTTCGTPACACRGNGRSTGAVACQVTGSAGSSGQRRDRLRDFPSTGAGVSGTA